jgi:excisionase family DNA binding protein
MRGGSMTGTVSSHLKTVREAAEVRGVLTSNKFHNGTSQGSSLPNAVIQLQPFALPPQAAAQLLSISKRSLSRLIAAGKIVARKEGSRTLVDVESLKAYYAGLPVKR